VLQQHHNQVPACVRLLLAAGASTDCMRDGSGTPLVRRGTPLSLAAACPCCTEPLKLLLAAGADPCTKQYDGVTAMHIAATYGRVEKCKLMIQANSAALEIAYEFGRTPLMCAASAGHADVIEMLHERGAKLDTVDSGGATALHLAATAGHISCMKYLLRHGINPNASVSHLLTPLCDAVRSQSLQAVKLLLSAGADPLLAPTRGADAGKHAVSTAVEYGAARALEMLLDSLGSAAVQQLLSSSAQPSLLVQAVTARQTAAARVLVARGAKGDAPDLQHGSITPLHCAATSDATADIVALLLHSGCAADPLSAEGESPLYVASSMGNAACVKALLAGGASAVQLTARGLTCLAVAVEKGHSAVVPLLLAHKRSAAVLQLRVPSVLAAEGMHPAVRAAACERFTPLMLCKEAPTVQALLKAGADVQARTEREGWSCLHVAAALQYPAAVLCLLIKAGADLSATNDEGDTAELALEHGNQLAAALLTRAARDTAGAGTATTAR
jgi:uncharacterized protein